MMMLRILRCSYCPGLLAGASVIIRGWQGSRESEGCGDGSRGETAMAQSQQMWAPPEAGKGGVWLLPQRPQKEHSPANTSISAQREGWSPEL